MQTTLSPAELEAVELSYARCMMDANFFPSFYATFIGSSPEIAAKFRHTEMQRQHRVLRQGLAHMFAFARGDPLGTANLARIAIVHGRAAHAIEPRLYPYWLEALVATVSLCDPQSTPESLVHWRLAMAPGITFFVEQY